MNIVYLAYRSWNLKILELLLKEEKNKPWKISLIIAPHDIELGNVKGVNGKKILKIDPTKISEIAELIQKDSPEVILCYSWSWILPSAILNIAPCWIMHPSKLPKYRGGSPIQNQLLDGVKESAVTVLKAENEVDAGEIYGQEAINFEGYLQDIFDRIADTGGKLTLTLLDQLSSGTLQGIKQDHTKATLCKRRKPSMSEITLDDIKTKPATYLYNKIRGLQEPYPEAFIVCGDGRKLFITKAHPEK